MRRVLSAVVALAMILGAQPYLLAAVLPQNTGAISGSAVVEGKPLGAISVRLRNVDSGQIAATTTTNANGEFKFNTLPLGNYVVETIGPDGATLLGTSPRIALVSGALERVPVRCGAGAGAGAGAAGAGAGAGAAAAGGGAFFASTAGIITAVAVGAGVTAGAVAANKNNNSNNNNGATATPNTASPSR